MSAREVEKDQPSKIGCARDLGARIHPWHDRHKASGRCIACLLPRNDSVGAVAICHRCFAGYAPELAIAAIDIATAGHIDPVGMATVGHG